jgi:hypothetical protein
MKISCRLATAIALAFALIQTSCFSIEEKNEPRLALFVGMDISGSFMRGKYFDESLEFLAHYLYLHLKGLGGAEKPASLFVGSIGGETPNQPKTFYPIQNYEHRSVEEILRELKQQFPKKKENPFTDYNAFFEHVGQTIKNKNLLMRPVSIVLISDGKVDVMPGKTGGHPRTLKVEPLERLTRDVTIRLLYTDAVTGKQWMTEMPRKRVKVWTQDAVVMREWKDPKIVLPGHPLQDQRRLFNWIKDNVDFPVRGQRVDARH